RRSEALTILRQNEDNPAARAVDAVLELLYGWHHPYGRAPEGTVIGVESVSRADMVAFHAARVRPAAMSLAVVGDVRPDHALERARQAFDDWAAEPPVPATVAVPPLSQGRRTRAIAMPGKTQTDIAYGFTAVRRLDPRYYAYWMMNNVLGEFGLGGRLAGNNPERQGMGDYALTALGVAGRGG